MNKPRRKELERAIELLTQARDIIEQAMEEEQDAHDNLPESFMYGEKGEAMEEAVSNLEDALSSLEDAECSVQGAIDI